MGILNMLQGLLGNLRPLEPRVIARKAAHLAFWRSRSWGWHEPRDAPSTFVIHIGTEDWVEYYQTHAAEISRRLESEITRSIQEHPIIKLQAAKKIHVILQEDSTLPRGETCIDTSFGTVDEPQAASEAGPYAADCPPTMPIFNDGESDAPDPVQPIPTNTPVLDLGKGGNDNTPVLEGIDAVGTSNTTLRVDQRVKAYLVEASGKRYIIHHGETIGVCRGSNPSDMPDVELPRDAYEYVSRHQGSFRYARGRWFFTQHSSNHTEIREGNRRRVLEQGDEHTLQDGTVVVFADGAPLTFQLWC